MTTFLSVSPASSSSTKNKPSTSSSADEKGGDSPIKRGSDLSSDLSRLSTLVKTDIDLPSHVSTLSKELHEQRLKSLKEVAEKLKEDSWRYPAPNSSVEKLLSL